MTYSQIWENNGHSMGDEVGLRRKYEMIIAGENEENKGTFGFKLHCRKIKKTGNLCRRKAYKKSVQSDEAP